MEATGETCKLCLKYIQGPSLAVLDENLLSKLEFLQMDLDQSVEESNSVCKECEEKIESAFDFKSCIVPSGSEEQTQKGTNDPSTSTGESSAEKAICHLCKNSVNATAVISLPKVLKDDSMMEVFQGHIPEMDLEGIENKMVCDACQKSLASFSTLIASWSIANGWNDDEDMKEDFDDFEMVQVKKEGFDELSDSNTNSSMGNNEVGRGAKSLKKTKSKNGQATVVKIKTEGDGLSDSCESASVNEKDIKKEPEGGAEMEDLQLKSEEVDIKPEDEDGEAAKTFVIGKNEESHPHMEISGKTIKKVMEFEESNSNTDEVRIFKCNQCFYKTKNKGYFKNHAKVHKNFGEVQTFYCEHCFYKTKYKRNLIGHNNSKHKSLNEVEKFECKECFYVTKNKSALKRHELKHKNFDEVPVFKCQHCSYVSKNRYDLKNHDMIHKNSEELSVIKCGQCSFQTKHKRCIKYHEKLHKSFSELKIFNCEHCTYKSKFKGHLASHKELRHQTIDELQTIQCDLCSYVAKNKSYLRRHEKIHKSFDEVPIYKCQQCSYVTKKRSNLKLHDVVHKSFDEVTIFSCQQCSFETKYKASLRLHERIHKSFGEVQVFKCEQCTYQTKRKDQLRSHNRHKHCKDEISISIERADHIDI